MSMYLTKNLSTPYTSLLENGITLVDIGCGGGLDNKWASLFPFLNYIGFDPNENECIRLNASKHPFRQAKYMAYAISGHSGNQTLFKTRSIFCYSLLKPNHKWLKRFSYWKFFEEIGKASVQCKTIDSLVLQEGLTGDILKLDTQGMELPILSSGESLLKQVFCVETETGFVENYIGETTYADLDSYMRSKGFLMFDMNINRIGRNNIFGQKGRHQPLWCEAVWFYDYVGQRKLPTPEQAFKYVNICFALGYYDFGLELAEYFINHEILTQDQVLHIQNAQDIFNNAKIPRSKLGKALSLLPSIIQRNLKRGIDEII